MTALLTRFETQLTAALEALTPTADGTDRPFRCVDTRAEEQHALGHRDFAFEMPSAVAFRETSGLRADVTALVTVGFQRLERTRTAFRRGVFTDLRDLVLAIRAVSWTDGVIGVALDESKIQIEPTEVPAKSRRGVATARYQAARVTLALAVLGDETED